MTKADIVELISREVDVPKKEIAFIIDSFFEKVKKNLAQGNVMELRGFGTFGFKIRKARIARNPRTNEKVQVPEHVIMHFKPGKEFKEIANQVSVEVVRQDIERKRRKPRASASGPQSPQTDTAQDSSLQ